LYLRKIKRKI